MMNMNENSFEISSTTGRRSDWMKVQVGPILLITAREVETQAIVHLVHNEFAHKPRRWFIDDKTYYDLGMIGGRRIFLVQSEMGTNGPGGALLTIHESINKLAPCAVVMVGIAFGMNPHRQRIGDILVSQQILDYEMQRVERTIDGQRRILPRGPRPEASIWLLDRCRSGLIDWNGPKVHFGLILSGAKLIDNQSHRDLLLRFEPEAIGGDMEGAGLYAAAQRKRVDWILIKAISDWADGEKLQKKESAQKKAACNAARFTIHVIQQGGFAKEECTPQPQ